MKQLFKTKYDNKGIICRYNDKYKIWINKEGIIYNEKMEKIKLYHNKSNTGRSYLYFNKDNYKRISAHRVIAYCWCKGYAKNKVVDHIDNNPNNNNPLNLQWITQSENIKKSYRDREA